MYTLTLQPIDVTSLQPPRTLWPPSRSSSKLRVTSDLQTSPIRALTKCSNQSFVLEVGGNLKADFPVVGSLPERPATCALMKTEERSLVKAILRRNLQPTRSQSCNLFVSVVYFFCVFVSFNTIASFFSEFLKNLVSFGEVQNSLPLSEVWVLFLYNLIFKLHAFGRAKHILNKQSKRLFLGAYISLSETRVGIFGPLQHIL